LKKPKVAKHMMFCRQHYFTCIDCRAVFWGKEYESHTTCISEAQKVQGSLFDADAEKKSTKGAAKQDDWVERVHAATDSSTGQMKTYFVKLQSYSNIPRKKKPFTNFVKNSLRIWNPKEVDELWAAIEAACPPKSAPAQAPKEAAALPQKRTLADVIDEVLENAGGKLKWSKLTESVAVKAPSELLQSKGEKDDLIMATVPEKYLSDEDPYVRKR
jgi:hypothetical protein